MLTTERGLRNMGVNVTRLLKSKGWSQAYLAEITGEDQMKISRTCRGLNDPGGVSLARIAEALDISIDRIFADPPEFSRQSA